jgi:hypothetical protein
MIFTASFLLADSLDISLDCPAIPIERSGQDAARIFTRITAISVTK